MTIPLCERDATVVGGPTSTPTPAPPYAGPSLLLPADGATFTLSSDTITLQWASVGALRENEAYVIIIVDATGGEGTETGRICHRHEIYRPHFVFNRGQRANVVLLASEYGSANRNQ